MAGGSDDVETLRVLEASLWRPETRFDTAHMERVLAPGFTEFGRSGERYSRDACLNAPSRAFEAELPLRQLRIELLGADVALLTYVSAVSDGGAAVHANRCSVWTRTAEGWRLRFHQGTPTAAGG